MVDHETEQNWAELQEFELEWSRQLFSSLKNIFLQLELDCVGMYMCMYVSGGMHIKSSQCDGKGVQNTRLSNS